MDHLIFLEWTILGALGFFSAACWLHWLRGADDGPSDGEETLEELLKGTGYAFDRRQKIFYSTLDAWQGEYGYCSLYDEAAVPLGMVLDCEPVRFAYGGRKWLIELWKGQYGITTGCEIGLYRTEDPNVFSGTFYHKVDEKEYLHMSLTLRKEGRVLFRRSGKHWWLTGFVPGEFSEPSELVMDAAVTFREAGMKRAFLGELTRMGYSGREIRTAGNTVFLTFTEPRSRQPRSRDEALTALTQQKNRFLCKQYRDLTEGSADMDEIFRKLKRNSPELYALLLRIGKSAQLFRTYGLPGQERETARP